MTTILWTICIFYHYICFYDVKHKTIYVCYQGRIQDFKLGGAHLKKLRRVEGGAKFFWGILCEKSRFYAKRSYFFPIAEEAAKMVGVFRVKNTILRQKIIFFPSFRGGGAGCAPPGSAPAIVSIDKTIYQGWIQDLWLGGVSRRGVWGPLKVPSWSRVEPW